MAREGQRYESEVTQPMTELDLESRTTNHPVQCFFLYITWSSVIEKKKTTLLWERTSGYLQLKMILYFRDALFEVALEYRYYVSSVSVSSLLFCTHYNLISNLLSLIPTIYYNSFVSNNHLAPNDKIVLNLF